MPVMLCEKHGSKITQFCCRHILAARQAGRAEQLFIEQESGGNLHLCRRCHDTWLTIPAKDREEQESNMYYEFFDLLTVECPCCLHEWTERYGIHQ
jgi:hypothetical protein